MSPHSVPPPNKETKASHEWRIIALSDLLQDQETAKHISHLVNQQHQFTELSWPPCLQFPLTSCSLHDTCKIFTPTYFDFFCNHTIDFKSKNPISNLWRNKLINNTTMIFFNFYSTISCFFIQNRNSQATWLWPVIFTLEILYNPLHFSSSSSLTLLQDDTVTWLSRKQSQAPFATVLRWINQHHQWLFRVSHVDWNTCRMAALAVTFSGRGACEWRCSPSYVTISMAGSSTARSTCFLAGHPLTLLHL